MKKKDEDLQVSNSFNVLKDKEGQEMVDLENTEREKQGEVQVEGEKLSSKDWVNKRFGKSKELQQDLQEADKGKATNDKNDKKEENQQGDVQHDENDKKGIENQKESNSKRLKKDEEEKQMQLFHEGTNELMVLEGISLLAIQLDKILDSCNEKKKDMDGSNLEDNFNQEIATLEDIIKVKEKQFEKNPSGVNRANLSKAQAELNLQLKREEEFWRQKAGRRSRLRIIRIQNKEGEWMEEEQEIVGSAINFLQNQFTNQEDSEDFSMLDEVPSLVTEQ
ncbi:E3 ubiquitin-protein ligase BRE1-like [Capsicum annuum]|uniref:E3 ubiquitin-protein ligase BRE1-like n=1 Tax=Capsicum annuum TaxID=4072 RepID=UPI001FB0B21E|nr:E3 ubiquitin-protein ligase BRE1-like [Capsicum annuum]